MSPNDNQQNRGDQATQEAGSPSHGGNKSPHRSSPKNRSVSPKNNNRSRSPKNRSRSPKSDNRSRSPKNKRNNNKNQRQHTPPRSPPHNGGGSLTTTSPFSLDRPPPDLAVLVYRVDMYDSGWSDEQDPRPTNNHGGGTPTKPMNVAKYSFRPNEDPPGSVAICKAPYGETATPQDSPWYDCTCFDSSVRSPFENARLIKYWNQRRRLFSLFDQGVQLDEEGWFSVTPEQIADHVACRLQTLSQGRPIVILDAFCGCGGNAIAFARIPNVTVIAVDVDRTKLRKAANNAAIYQIPTNKIYFVECNVLFLLEHCYRNGEFRLDQPLETPEAAMALMNAMPPPVECEICSSYQVGGIDILPRTIDAVFMDPPWGGVDYEVFGKNGYDLQRNMRIQRPNAAEPPGGDDGTLNHDFFDTFTAAPRSRQERRTQFNCHMDDANCVNGTELLTLAASATSTHWVIFDVPRNTSKGSLGQSALAAGYHGNVKLEEHYLNGRLKTVTAYLGSDWSSMLESGEETPSTC